MTDRTVRVRLEVIAGDARRDVKGFSDDLKGLRGEVGGLHGVTQKLSLAGGVGAALGGIGAFEVIKKVVGGASDLNETVSKSQQVFGASAGAIKAWSSTSATSMGLSQRAALDGASSFQNLFSQIGIAGKAASGMSTNLVKLAGDFASFHNAKPEEVMDALLSATRGEYDALQRFVPTVNAAAIEQQALADTGKSSAKELTNAEKAIALYEIVVKDAGAATGDFARTSDSAANQQRILVAELEDTAAKVGNLVLPAYQNVLGVINDVGPGTVAAAAGVALLSNRLAASTKDGDGLLASLGEKFQTNINASREAGERFSTTLGVARTAGQGLSSAIGGIVGLFGGPWGLALTAATVGVGLLVKQHQEEQQVNQQVIASGQELVQVYKDQGTAAGDAAFQRKLNQPEFAKEITNLHDLGVSAYDLKVAYQGNADVQSHIIDRLREKKAANAEELEAMRASVDVGNADNVAIAQRSAQIEDQNGKIDGHISRLEKEWHGVKDVADAHALLAQQSSFSALSLDTWGAALAKSTEGSREQSQAIADNRGQQASLEEMLRVLTDTTATSTEKANALTAAYHALYDASINLTEADESFEASLDSLTESVAKNGTTLDIHTAAGRANRDAIEQVLQSSIKLTEADVASGASVEEATRRHRTRTQALLDQLPPTMRNQSETLHLIDIYGQVPGDIQTDVGLQGVEGALAKLKEMKAAQLALEANISGAEAMGTINRDAYWRSIYRASGGPVYGPGGPRDDLIAAVGPGGARYRLSDGEYVQQAAAVDYYGQAFMAAINDRVIPKRLLTPEILGAVNRSLRPKVNQPGDGSYGIAFARGGMVHWPFPVDVSKTKIPVPQASAEAQNALTFLRAQDGKPYVWASAGPGGYDCSGIVSAVWNILHGRSPYSHTFSTFDEAGYFPKGGFGAPLTAGWSNPGESGGGDVGHTAAVLVAGMTAVPFESGGGWGGVHVGAGSTPVRSFAHIGHFDQGGPLYPGWTAAWNGTGHAEWVSAGPGGAGAGTTVVVNLNGPVFSGYQAGQQVADALRSFVERNGGSVQRAVVGRMA